MSAKHVSSSSLDVKPDSYFFTLSQIANDYAVIASDDSLRLFDVSSLEKKLIIQSCNKSVACITTDAKHRSVLTAGRDGLVNGWDPLSGKTTTQLREPKGAGITAIACQDQYVAAGTESTSEGLGDVRILVYDMRNPSQPLRSYGDSHTDTITALQWHASQPSLLLSGSTDGLVSIFDVDQADEEDAIKQVLNPKSAVHCAGFRGNDEAYILTTDEQFSIYGLDKTGTADDEALPMTSFGDMRAQLSCMYAIDLLLPQSSTPVIAHGHNQNQALSLTLLEGPGLSPGRTVSFPGAHGEEVVRDFKLVDRDNLVLSCGEDGQVRCWRLPEDLMSRPDTSGMMDIDAELGSAASKKPTKDRKKDKRAEKRFAPY